MGRRIAGLGLLLAAVALAPMVLAQGTPLPEGCAQVELRRWVCSWQVAFGPGVEEPFRTPLPAVGTFVAEVLLRTSSYDVDWIILDQATGDHLSARNSPSADPRAEEFSWVSLVEPLPGAVPLFHFEQFLQNDEESGETINALLPPATHPGAYNVTVIMDLATGILPAASIAGSAADPHLEDALGDVGDAPAFADITGGWFHDPILDDGLIEVGLAVPGLAALTDDDTEAYEWHFSWDLLGQRYRVMWGTNGAVVAPLNSTHPRAAQLYKDTGGTPLHIMDLTPRADPPNGTLAATIPLRAIGSPANGSLFANFTGLSQRLYYRSVPFDPLSTTIPGAGVEVLDTADTQRRAFAVGDEELWRALRGEPPLPPPTEAQQAPVAPVDPWAQALPYAAVGSLLLVGLGAVVLLARRQRIAGPPVERPPEPGGVFLGKYHVERELGRGASGSAWLAMHLNLRRSVVIKQMHPELARDAAAIERFRREAQILASLDHLHITRIYDVELVGGAWYIVMEFVDGGSLEDRMARGRPGLEETARCILGVLDGLAYIHGRGVLHLDVKPGNILLTSTGVAKIVDFGVATTRAHRDQAQGTSSGTPLYQAPEVLRGEPADERSDLYSVAGTFYRVVTGRHHIDADPDDFVELRRAVLEVPSRLPVPELPAPVNAWLARALAKAPGDRFPDAASMRAGLAAAFDLTGRRPREERPAGPPGEPPPG